MTHLPDPWQDAGDYDIWSGRLSRSAIAKYAADHPDDDAELIARILTAPATKAQLRVFAESYVRLMVGHVRREWAREAEDRAAAERRRTETERRMAERMAEEERRQLKAAASAAEDYQQLFDDPARYAGNASERKGFRKWAGDRFGEWYERGCAAAAAKGEKELCFFEADWYEGGLREYWEIRRMQHVRQLIDEHAELVRLETTRELLATVFALGDGTETTWGNATVAEHRQRIEMLAKNAAGVVETAARHEAAVRMIEEAGVTCLAELAAGRAERAPAA